MSLTKNVLVMAFCMAICSYWLYEPLHPDIDQIGYLRVIIALNKIIKVLGSAAETLGITSSVNFTRASTRLIIQSTPKMESLEIYNDNFSGVPVRIFRPVLDDKSSQDELLPGLVFIHGGGWVLLDVDVYNTLTAKLAKETGMVVVSVDYRRAPEHKFPIPFDDCVTAAVHLLRHGADHGVDVNKIAVAGDSAGGNLAAAVTQRLAVETDLPPLKAQVLIYPCLQAFDFMLPSMRNKKLPGFLDKETLIYYWLLYYQGNTDNIEKFVNNNHTSPTLKASEYAQNVDPSRLPAKIQKLITETPKDFGDAKLSDAFEKTLLNPYFCPLMARKLDNLPPTLFISAEFDVLRDEGFMYVKRLEEAGVQVEHKHFESLYHGFINLDDTEGQEEFLDTVNDFLHVNL